MEPKSIKIGHCYTAIVNKQTTTVRINAPSSAGGWDAINITTGRKVHIKTAQRLKGEVKEKASAKRIEVINELRAHNPFGNYGNSNLSLGALQETLERYQTRRAVVAGNLPLSAIR